MKDKFSVLVGGEAGHGVKKSVTEISSFLSEKGRYVFQMDDYQSLIRGGHNFSIVTSDIEKVYSHYEDVELGIMLDKRSYENHYDDITDEGVLIYDPDQIEDAEGIQIKIKEIVKEHGGNDQLRGTIALSCFAYLCNIPLDDVKEKIRENYSSEDVNIEVVERVYSDLKDEYPKSFELEEGDAPNTTLYGNESTALGAVSSGLESYWAYPMTPASPILHFLAENSKDLGVTTVHPENEIAAINNALGAAYAGSPSMVGTSGGGFALMQETFSMAGTAETPLVAILASRPGPATGLATYTGQEDLELALNSGHGEFPYVVLSPADTEQGFEKAGEALWLAWKYRTQVIYLTEKHLAESMMTTNVGPDSVPEVDPKMYEGDPQNFKSYKLTEDGVSPLLFPPVEGAVIRHNSHENDELGITTDEPETTVDMRDKRLRKKEGIEDEIRSLNPVEVLGNGDNAILTYGSTTISVLEALKHLDKDLKVIQPIYLRPFPEEKVKEEIKDVDNLISIELSSMGSFTTLIREKGIKIDDKILKYDGRSFDPIELSKSIKEVVK